MKRVVCFSGGHSSALVAIEVARKFQDDEIILLNHNINPSVELADVKRFKKEVSEYLNLPITYANYENLKNDSEIPDQFDVCKKIGGFKFGKGTELCTHRLKTKPFYDWLSQNCFPSNTVIYYGFDANEMHRVQRRSSILAVDGFKTDFPIALWQERTITQTMQVGIARPAQYDTFKHANCVGCLKAGKQHWYVVYCTRPDIFYKAKATEQFLDHSIIKGFYLDELEEQFTKMKKSGVPANEHMNPNSFWAKVRKMNLDGFDFDYEINQKPCECVF